MQHRCRVPGPKNLAGFGSDPGPVAGSTRSRKPDWYPGSKLTGGTPTTYSIRMIWSHERRALGALFLVSRSEPASPGNYSLPAEMRGDCVAHRGCVFVIQRIDRYSWYYWCMYLVLLLWIPGSAQLDFCLKYRCHFSI